MTASTPHGTATARTARAWLRLVPWACALLLAACGGKHPGAPPRAKLHHDAGGTPDARATIDAPSSVDAAIAAVDATADAPEAQEEWDGESLAELTAFLKPGNHVTCAPPAAPPAADDAVTFFFSPARPHVGAPLRVTVVSAAPQDADRLTLQDHDGRRPLEPVESWGGPPWAWGGTLGQPPAGRLRICLAGSNAEAPVACGTVLVADAPPAPPRAAAPTTGVWSVKRSWSRTWEDLYAAWVARLFLTEPGMTAGWRPMHKALRDAARNLLFGHLGLGEDDPDVPPGGAGAAGGPDAGTLDAQPPRAVVAPDCGDAPYFLRAYFAWKLGLPFAAHLCPRGTPGEGPGCDGLVLSNATPAFDDVADPVERFDRFLDEGVGRFVHSGTARTLPEDEFSDFYPVALSREALRPGTIFVDPRGHVLIVTRWLPGTEHRIGTLFAVDGHPDQSVSYKRFATSTFFFSPRLRTGGFKAFRPLGDGEGGTCFVANTELTEAPGPAPYSLEQFGFADADAFYRRMDELLNPYPPEPVAAYRERMELLVELLADRASAVRTAVEYMDADGWARVPMPGGADIFTTSGAWEDYATPARDLRLLVAADELLGFPQRVAEDPGLFRIAPDATPEQVQADLDAAWAAAKDELHVDYTRSDGSTWTLTLAAFLARLGRFETAYNPNDCPEVRWGAAEGTDEYATCVHRAPDGQQRLMEGYRFWFATRRQPAVP